MIKHSSPKPLRPLAPSPGKRVWWGEHSRNSFFSAASCCVAYTPSADLTGLLLCVRERERDRACVLWRRPISLGPVFVVIGGAVDPILCLLPLDIS